MSAASPALLNGAVHQHPVFDKRGMAERLFTAWFGGFFYNQIWEDPRVDMAALRLSPQNDVLAISSAGCNVLSYLCDRPRSITAVDLNPCHIYLTRLKLAALQSLPSYEEFFRFFGCADSEQNLHNYYQYICEALDSATRTFWEGGSWMRRRVLGPRVTYFSRNLYDYARLGYFLRFVHGLARAFRRDPAEILRARTPEEQETLYQAYIEPFFQNWFVRKLGQVPFLLFGIGIPPRQMESLRRESGGHLTDVMAQRVRKLACAYSIGENYFAWQAFGRRYDARERRAVPEYLKESNYAVIKAGVGRTRTEITSLHLHLRQQPENSLDRFVFLDAQDWMRPEEIEDLWRALIRVGRPGTRIIFRTASSRSPVEDALAPETRSRFVYERDLSLRLFEQDRASVYGGFHVYSKPA